LQVLEAVARGEGEQAVIRAVANLDSLPIPGDKLVAMLEVCMIKPFLNEM
jgi:hypothetical protein